MGPRDGESEQQQQSGDLFYWHHYNIIIRMCNIMYRSEGGGWSAANKEQQLN